MINRQLGPYLIVEKLGEGGMGAVYKARDTRLNRFVAIKVLPPGKVATEDRRRRFLQEAQAASGLNHPNIVVIHDIAEFEGEYVIVMEYVAGRTLDRIVTPQGLPLADVLNYAVEIAAGLEAAHGAGVLHRDLKPSNVIVGDNGRAKLLDFGLAKLMDADAASAPDDATRTVAAQTAQGTILGTANYMSPEQAEGKKLDARSDIFSFGAMLYELLSGRRAFQGETTISTITAILRDEPPPLSGELPGLPREVESLVRRCLRKDPARRFQTAADLRAALEDAREEAGAARTAAIASPSPPPSSAPTSAVTAPAPSRPWRFLWPAVGLLAVLAAGGTWWALRPGAPEAPLIVRPLTQLPGSEYDAAFSPDGNMVAFSWDGVQRESYDIYVRLIDGGEPVRLTTDAAYEGNPLWSPDARRIVFTRSSEANGIFDTSVVEKPALGGTERNIGHGVAQDWSPDGRWLLVDQRTPRGGGSVLRLMSPSDGSTRDLPSGLPTSYSSGRFSPDSRWIYCTVQAPGSTLGNQSFLLYRTALDGGSWERVALENFRLMARPAVAAELILFGRDDRAGAPGLYRAPLSGGVPTPLPFGSAGPPVTSARGDLLAWSVSDSRTYVSRAPLRPAPGAAWKAEKLETGARMDSSVSFSSDGRRIATSSIRGDGGIQIWTYNADGGSPRQLTELTSYGAVGSPQWSPDDKWIAFDARPSGGADVYLIPAAGGEPRRVTDHASEDIVPCWSHDGEWIYFTSARSGEHQLWRVKPGGGAPEQITRYGGFQCRATPDGKYLYYLQGRNEGRLRRIALDTRKEEDVWPELRSRNWALAPDGIYALETGTAQTSFTSRVGEGLFYRFATRKVEKLGFSTPHPVNANGIAISPDGRTVYFAMRESLGADLVLVENFR